MNRQKKLYQYTKLLVKVMISIAQFSFILNLAWKFEQYFIEYKMKYINLWTLLIKIIIIILIFNVLLSLKKIIHIFVNFICKYLEVEN